MAYLQQTSSNQKAVTMGAVAAIHAIAIYAVVSGLAVDIIRDPQIILTSWHRPIEKKPDPPKDIPKDTTTPKDTVQTVVPDSPIPPLGGTSPTEFDFGPTGGEADAGGGDVGRVEFPQPPISEPTPRFTAKAPKPRGIGCGRRTIRRGRSSSDLRA
jgi:protein TonB